jgi:hypothetical protein
VVSGVVCVTVAFTVFEEIADFKIKPLINFAEFFSTFWAVA